MKDEASPCPRRGRMNDPAVREELLMRTMEGQLLSAICDDPNMPSRSSVYRFLAGTGSENLSFREAFDDARLVGVETLADEILAIADDTSTPPWIVKRNENGEVYFVRDPHQLARAKQQIRLRQWVIERLLPGRFGSSTKRRPAQQGPQPFNITYVDQVTMPEDREPDGLDI